MLIPSAWVLGKNDWKLRPCHERLVPYSAFSSLTKHWCAFPHALLVALLALGLAGQQQTGGERGDAALLLLLPSANLQLELLPTDPAEVSVPVVILLGQHRWGELKLQKYGSMPEVFLRGTQFLVCLLH